MATKARAALRSSRHPLSPLPGGHGLGRPLVAGGDRRKYSAEGHARHPWQTRTFWPVWFSTDNVHPSPDHVPYLPRRLEPVHFAEARDKVPYMPFLRAPYYQFIGRKKAKDAATGRIP